MSYVSVSGGISVQDALRQQQASWDPNRQTFADYWAQLQAEYKTAKAAQDAAEAKAAYEKAQLGKVTAETEAAIEKAKAEKARALAEQQQYAPPGTIFGFAPTTLVLIGAAGYFLFIKKKGRR